MPRFTRTLSLLLIFSLLLLACGLQTANRRPQADGGQPALPARRKRVLQGARF
jgi:hypothetical protein